MQREKRQSDDIVNTIIQLGSKLVPLIMTFFGGSGPSSANQATDVGSNPATDLSKLPTLAGESSKPAAATIANKVSTTPEKADKVGVVVRILQLLPQHGVINGHG